MYFILTHHVVVRVKLIKNDKSPNVSITFTLWLECSPVLQMNVYLVQEHESASE